MLKNVYYTIGRGEIVCLLGGNASGKSTTMKTIMGVVRPMQRARDLRRRRDHGHVHQRTGAPRHRPGAGGAPAVPAHDRLRESGDGRLHAPKGPEFAQDLDRVYTLFPRVKERRNQIAGTLSGGEQQMVAIGRALMARPRLICMDEPSMGLSPLYVEQVFDIIQQINAQGTTIFMVEQNASMALSIAHRAYVLQTGRVVLSGTAQELRENPAIREAYLGEMQVPAGPG